MQRVTLADDAGGSSTKAGADFLRRGGNDVVEALTDGLSALRVIEVLEAATRSLRSGGAPIEVA